jgi:hypothetical protein
LDVQTFVVSTHVLAKTIAFLREAGKSQCEGFVLWSGRFVSETQFFFTSALIPPQHALRTDDGLMVVVEGDALFIMNKLAHEKQEILAAQVHTHPSAAYHSDTDDHFPLVTLLGALSLVLPNFARNAPHDMDDWAWYRLEEYGDWRPLSEKTLVKFQ